MNFSISQRLATPEIQGKAEFSAPVKSPKIGAGSNKEITPDHTR